MNELFEISGVELASLELFPLVLRGDVSVECVGEEDLEHDVQDYHEDKKHATRVEDILCSK